LEDAVLTDDLVVLAGLGEALGAIEIGVVATDPDTHREYANAMFPRITKTDADRRRIIAALHATARRPDLFATAQPMGAVTRRAVPIEVGVDRTRIGVTVARVGSWLVAILEPVDDRRSEQPPVSEARPPVDRALTPREREVADLLKLGRKNTEIAEALDISPFTARRHTERILMKLGVKSRAQVAAMLLGVAGVVRKAG
jgi:DNA-binding CsgD family transcriptional regulator